MVPSKGKFNDFREKTFDYFYSKFINNFLIDDLKLEFSLYCLRIKNNINIIFLKLCKIFTNFDIFYKQFFIF